MSNSTCEIRIYSDLTWKYHAGMPLEDDGDYMIIKIPKGMGEKDINDFVIDYMNDLLSQCANSY